MTVVREWHRTNGQFIHNGATPTSFNQGNTFNITPPAGKAMTLLSVVTDLELYIACNATMTNLINPDIWQETVMVLGVEAYPSTAGELISSTPLSSPNANPAALKDWCQWNYMYSDIQDIDLNAPETATVVWRPIEGTVRTDSRREVPINVGIDIWLAWEIQDGAGLINGTHAGVSYNLGARFTHQVLVEFK